MVYEKTKKCRIKYSEVTRTFFRFVGNRNTYVLLDGNFETRGAIKIRF